MELSVVQNTVMKLWDAWNIRVLIIISISVQSFLILFGPLRKQKGGNWVVMISIWLAYLLADWVPTFTIGLIFRAEHNDILALWAPFLLLHLGGPDTITFFSLEDNEFWIRHLLGLLLQLGSTVYVIIQSFPHNKLFFPTFLVLIVGIIKYAERNRAFYLASFDNFGENWPAQVVLGYTQNRRPLVPQQFTNDSFVNWESIFKKAILTFGSIKSYLVGPLMPSFQQRDVTSIIHRAGPDDALRIIEIHLSLLYELLHTKLPVIDSTIGYVCSIVNFFCILGAFLSFLSVKKHYKIEMFDIRFTYGLLIGALALDIISVLILDIFDWFVIAFFINLQSEFINRRRWSNSISQLSFITYHVKKHPTDQENVKKHPDWFNKLVDFLFVERLFEFVRRIRCVSSKEFRKDQEWQLIFTELDRKISNADNAHQTGNEIRPKRCGGILEGNADLGWSIQRFEYMQSLLMWHIATEICYLEGDTNNSRSHSRRSTPLYIIDHKEICKLLSNYMLYLVVMEPTMMAAVSDNWKMVLKETSEEAKLNLGSISNELDFSRAVVLLPENGRHKRDNGVLFEASFLANKLLQHQGCCPWELMSRVWIELVCHAAINCSPIVHARQLSKGGELLTLVWLLMNHSGLTPKKEW